MTTNVTFSEIIQNLQVKIQDLEKNGDNKNNKIDTTNEKNKLAQLLSGAKQEVNDLYKSKHSALENIYKERTYQELFDDKEYNKLLKDEEMAMSEIKNLSNTLKYSLKPYEQALQQREGNNKRIVKTIDNKPYMESKRYYENDIPEFVIQRNDILKVRSDNSYEVKLNESENVFNVIIKDDNENEIGRKSYTKSQKSIYTNKDFVAKNCGLYTKENIDNIKLGKLARYALCLVPLGATIVDARDVKVGALEQLKDDEAMDMASGSVYKWNPKTHEYKVTGRSISLNYGW